MLDIEFPSVQGNFQSVDKQAAGVPNAWKSGCCCLQPSVLRLQPLLQCVEFVGEALGEARAELGEVLANGGDFG